ncbi:MAG: heavy metal-binding domain-containing protein [Defluviitaleaceae bacterium]|nr:heavy metal-binding domain-containing protein [Defluviitaleaceae bacterium]
MLLVNTDYIPGKTLKPLGLVSGDGVPLLYGTFISDKIRNRAIKRMTVEATALGADAIINVRWIFESGQAFVYGTAVKYED